ncbi:terminase, partial [Salmonella enterica subsp. enterica serovar Montevideo]|nr:terminase [Salmonella enterica subsp. enterica serovar Montevideo]
LDRNAGVRKEIERLERALKPKAEAPPRKTTKPRTRKPVARPACVMNSPARKVSSRPSAF